MFDKKRMKKEREELKTLYNHDFDERKKILKGTEKIFHELIIDFVGKEGFTSEQIT